MIPAGQGGLLTHAMATAVAAIKVSHSKLLHSYLERFVYGSCNASAGDNVHMWASRCEKVQDVKA